MTKNNLTLNFELDKVKDKIRQEQARHILLQLPDGLKPRGKQIQEELLAAFPTLKIDFWAGDCYGACDVPRVGGYDLFIAFGHSEWR